MDRVAEAVQAFVMGLELARAEAEAAGEELPSLLVFRVEREEPDASA